MPFEIDGQPIPPKDPALMIVFKGDGWYGMDTDRKTLVQGHIVRLDTTRRPKAIDLHNLGPDRNPRGRAWIQGIYELAGRHPDPLPELRRRRPSHRIRNQGWPGFVLARRLPARSSSRRDAGSVEQKLIQSRDLEDALYKVLKRDHEFNDPVGPS